MRILGLVMFLAGAAATAAALAASFERKGAVAALAGLAAPVAVLVALCGALLMFVPGFFG